MKAQIKELLKVWLLGDIKRPPKFYAKFESPTLPFKYQCRQDEYRGKSYVFMCLNLEKAKIEVSWSARSLKWDILIVSDNFGTLTYEGTYYKFNPELKRIIDFMCDAARREYQAAVRRESISNATREVNLFRELLPQIEALENDRAQKEWESKNRNMIETVSDVL